MIISYVILIILFLLCLLAYFIFPNINILKDFSPNLAAEIFGILLVVFLIDRVIRISQQKESKKRQEIAWRQLRIPLLRHFNLLFNMFKASTQAKPPKVYNAVTDLFDDTYFAEIGFLDFSKPAPVLTPRGSIDWFTHVSHKFSEFKDALNNTVQKYALYLDTDIIDLLEGLINSSFISFMMQASNLPKIDKTKGYKRQYNLLNGLSDPVKEYTDLFSKLVLRFNQNLVEEEKIKMIDAWWSDNIAPKISSGRI